MRIHYLLIVSVLLFASCKNKGNSSEDNMIDSAGNNVASSGNGKQNGFWQKLEMIEIGDGKGGVAATIPMPSSWKFTNEGIVGPNGIKITDFKGGSYMINYNQSLQQAYSGTQQRQLPEIEQLIQEDIVPWANNRGLQFVKSYEIPEVSKIDKWYSDQLYKAMPSRSDVVAYGIDFKTNDDKSYFVLLHVNASTTQTMQNWYYYFTGLEADAAHFELAKKQYIFSLANTRYNLEPIAEYNKAEMQRVGQNWAAFNQRMAQNQATFEANQRAFVNKSDAINDAIMSGWRASNAASDKQQEQRVDAIYERTNVQNSETGQTYKVQEGSNQYWMNNNGEYIGTQLQGYNPNLDENMNEQKWQELQRINK
jgi:hypothetical protein